MEQLFSLNDIPPRFLLREAPRPNMSVPQQDVENFLRFHFAPGLDKFFETTWYSSRGTAHLRQDPLLLDFVAQCEEQFRTPDANQMQGLQSLEARLVWQLAIMPRSSSNLDQLILDLLPRIDIVENLLTGHHLPHDRVPSAPTQAQQNDAVKYNEVYFWHQLGSFTSYRDDGEEPLTIQAINDALGTTRSILGVMENRDVLYSLAMLRYIGGRMDGFDPRQQLPVSNGSDDDITKLEVARHHVEVEGLKGTTQVIQRICDMAMRSCILHKQ